MRPQAGNVGARPRWGQRKPDGGDMPGQTLGRPPAALAGCRTHRCHRVRHSVPVGFLLQTQLDMNRSQLHSRKDSQGKAGRRPDCLELQAHPLIHPGRDPPTPSTLSVRARDARGHTGGAGGRRAPHSVEAGEQREPRRPRPPAPGPTCLRARGLVPRRPPAPARGVNSLAQLCS